MNMNRAQSGKKLTSSSNIFDPYTKHEYKLKMPCIYNKIYYRSFAKYLPSNWVMKEVLSYWIWQAYSQLALKAERLSNETSCTLRGKKCNKTLQNYQWLSVNYNKKSF